MAIENGVQRHIRPMRLDRNYYDLGRAIVEVYETGQGKVHIRIEKPVTAHPGHKDTQTIVLLELTRAEWDLLTTLGTVGPTSLEED